MLACGQSNHISSMIRSQISYFLDRSMYNLDPLYSINPNFVFIRYNLDVYTALHPRKIHRKSVKSHALPKNIDGFIPDMNKLFFVEYVADKLLRIESTATGICIHC